MCYSQHWLLSPGEQPLCVQHAEQVHFRVGLNCLMLQCVFYVVSFITAGVHCAANISVWATALKFTMFISQR